MNICVFGSASSLIDENYIKAGEKAGEILAVQGHNLIFGGGNEGMMGAAARGFRKGGGHITGVIPEFFREREYERLYPDCDETIYTEDIAERLRYMENMSDVFLVMPGGAGTYEEFFKVLVSKSLDRHDKELLVFNVMKYFDPLISMINSGVDSGFISAHCAGNFHVFNDDHIYEMADYLGSISCPEVNDK